VRIPAGVYPVLDTGWGWRLSSSYPLTLQNIGCYLDPPYYGCENYYGDGIFSMDDFGKLSGILRGLKGKLILSINDHPQIRETFKGFRISKEKARYTAGHTSPKQTTEFLISNY
jgi:DNA adenine methylase